MTEKAPSERREHPRVRLEGTVDYAGSEGLRCTEIKNISVGGLRLHLSGRERPGARVALRIELPGAQAVDVAGQVVWARQSAPFEVGVRFINLDAASAWLLDQHVDRQE